MKFSKLADVLEMLENTGSSNKMSEIAAKFFQLAPQNEIGIAAHLMLGEIAPAYTDINMGMAEKMAVKAIAIAFGKKEANVSADFKKKGDIGLAAEALAMGQEQLTLKEVFKGFHNIAKSSGTGSQEKRVRILAQLLKKANRREARYLARIIVGTLRTGASTMTILDGLAIAFTGAKKNRTAIERAYDLNPDIGIIAEQLAKKGLKGIKTIITIGRPIKMMLCQRIQNLSDIKKKMGLAAVEDKLDGERIQAHCDGTHITLFSRRMENITAQFPDVVEACRKNVKAKNYIIEGEVVPIDKKGGILSFQLLMQRRRKHNIKEYITKIPVRYFVFDLLLLENKPYLQEPYPTRRKKLENIIKNSWHIQLIRNKITSNIDEIKKFFETGVQKGTEGVVIKSCAKESVYKAGTRAWLWVKWKQEYAKGLRDTFDLVAVGAFSGKGRRKSGYGALLCAAYNKNRDLFETFCKIGSGFTDKQLAELPKKFKKLIVKEKPKNVSAVARLNVDSWFEPKIVVEVLGAEITKSPIHSCAKDNDYGLALRFPRFLRYREDKKAEQATTVDEIIKIHRWRIFRMPKTAVSPT